MDSVIITGATGFIGSHITGAFCKQGIRVGCLIRETSNKANIEGLPVEVHTGDIRNIGELRNAFRGYDCVIHNAAKACDWGSWQDFYDTNVKGTMNVLKACVQVGIKNIIMTCSDSVYGEEHSMIVKDEESPYNSHYDYLGDKIFPCAMNYYRDSKALAKKNTISFARYYNLNLTILEPVFVYGEREFNTGFYEYLKTVKSGIPFLPGSKKNKFHVVYAGDLARAYFLAFKKELLGVNCIVIGNQEAARMEKIYELFCQEAGFRKPANFPKVLVYPAAFVMELIYTVLKIKSPPLLTRGRVNMFYDNVEFSVKKAEELLGFKNEYTLEEGIKKTVQWYKQHSLL